MRLATIKSGEFVDETTTTTTELKRERGKECSATEGKRSTEAAPIKCDGRESAGRPTDSHIERAGRPTNSLTESVGKPADSLPSHFIGAASGIG